MDDHLLVAERHARLGCGERERAKARAEAADEDKSSRHGEE